MANPIAKAIYNYQASRAQFADAMRTLLAKDDNGKAFKAALNADVISLLSCPLLEDVVPSIQVASLATLSKLAKKAPNVEDSLTKPSILDDVVKSLAHQNRLVRLQGHEALQSIAAKSATCAAEVKAAGAGMPLLLQLEDTDDELSRASVKSMNKLISASEEMAVDILHQTTIELLVGHLQSAAASQQLKTLVAGLLADACKSKVLTPRVVELNGLAAACRLACDVASSPALLGELFRLLSQIAKHTDALAADIVSRGVIPHVVRSLTCTVAHVRWSAAQLVYELSSKTAEIAESVAANGGIVCMVQNMGLDKGRDECVPTVLAVGHMAAFKERLAKMIVEAQGGSILVELLRTRAAESTPDLEAAVSWTLSQIAKHGKETAAPLAEVGALPTLMSLYVSAGTPEGVKSKAQVALETLINSCAVAAALEPLVQTTTPLSIISILLQELVYLLPRSEDSKRTFVTSGALMRLQQVASLALEASVAENVANINSLFPTEVVQYYS